MRHSTGTPTKAEQERFDLLHTYGCHPCKKMGYFRNTQIHHIVEGNRRLGHLYTLPWCPWHHQGYADFGLSTADMRNMLGPSFAREPRAFRSQFGTERTQLIEVDMAIGWERAA